MTNPFITTIRIITGVMAIYNAIIYFNYGHDARALIAIIFAMVAVYPPFPPPRRPKKRNQKKTLNSKPDE